MPIPTEETENKTQTGMMYQVTECCMFNNQCVIKSDH